MNKLNELAKAIAWHEGWKPGSRAYRNNNPGNLRRSPMEDGHEGSWEQGNRYAIFRDVARGFTALLYDLQCKATGKTAAWHDADKDGVKDPSEELTPDDTLAEFFRVYAPAEDANNPASYCAVACRIAGLQPTDTLASLLEPTMAGHDPAGGVA